MIKETIDSLKVMPDLSNRYYFWRAMRLAFAITCVSFIRIIFQLDAIESTALFSSVLFLSIVDMSANFSVRIKMLLITLVSTILITILTIVLIPHQWIMFIYIPILVYTCLFGAKIFPAKNMFLNVSLLSFVFAFPLASMQAQLSTIIEYQFLGGLWYLSTVFFGFTLFNFLKITHSKWANYFYLDESFALEPNERFITPREEVLKLIEEEKEGELFIAFRHPFRLIVSLIIGYFLVLYFNQPNSYWILMTIIFIHNPSKIINASIPRIVQRFLGTMLGLILVALLAEWISISVYWILIIFLASVPIFLFIRDNYFIAITFITILVMANFAFLDKLSYSILVERAIDTCIAIVLVLGVHLSLYCIKRLGTLNKEKN